MSWAAIFAGAVTALALSILLTLLAAGFGLTLGWGGVASRASLGVFTPALGAWAIAIQVIAAAFGGYLAGRLRQAWVATHADEAHFRDTAHGLVAWALATLAGVVVAVTVLAPYAEAIAPPVTAAAVGDPQRAASIAAQSAFFTAVGMLLAAFVAAVAGRLGGLRTEEMHAKART